MISTDNFELDIIDIGANGKGIAKQDGLVCFVPFSITGEKVNAKVTKFGKNFCECALIDVITPSQNRTKPVCKYFEICGGCQLQHTNEVTELKYKTQQVKTILERELKHEIDVNPCIGKNQYNYRNKVNFSIKNNKLCFCENDSTIEIDNCPLFVEDLTNIISIFNAYLKSSKHNFRALHIRLLDGTYQFTFVSESFNIPNTEKLINNLISANIKFSLFVSKNITKNSSNITPNTLCIYGEQKQDYNVLGIKNKISPPSFLQVNTQIQNIIYDKIKNTISSTSEVINAYGGTGILSSVLAQSCQKVYSIELNQSACNDCKEMLKENNINNVESICGDCKNEIPKLLDNNISHIVFDPPRNGVDSSILEQVLNTNIPTIIYLSCNPSTLARDIRLLSKKYEPVFVQPYNMFPQTYHIETLVCLKLKK